MSRRGDRRLASIDLVRGLVMVVMALDHVRDMMMASGPAGPDFAHAGLPLFLTRWVTHLCAPTFVLLAGTGAYLYGATGRRTTDVARFLLTRGAWLVLVEVTVVSFAWNFNLGPASTIPLQVIWAIGCSMIALAALVWLPVPAIAALGATMVVAHNLLDGIQPPAADASLVWRLLHIQGPLVIGGRSIAFLVYPLIPWVGVMALGYALGAYFIGAARDRAGRLVQIGLVLTVAFGVLRALDLYGEPVPWTRHVDLGATVVSFLNVTKYPPSLQFLLMTLGPALMLLGWAERREGRSAEALATLGRVPFFYYVAHLYLIHAAAVALGVAQGFALRQVAVIFFAYPPGFGVSLGTVYLLWLATIVALYPACAWFAGVKARRREWWLSYL